jgi:hypothetical protein
MHSLTPSPRLTQTHEVVEITMLNSTFPPTLISGSSHVTISQPSCLGPFPSPLFFSFLVFPWIRRS